MKIEYPINWDDLDHFERPKKGWLDDVYVTTDDGRRHRLVFRDITRLQQDLEAEIELGKNGIYEKGLFVIKEVTKDEIELAIKEANNEGYFDA